MRAAKYSQSVPSIQMYVKPQSVHKEKYFWLHLTKKPDWDVPNQISHQPKGLVIQLLRHSHQSIHFKVNKLLLIARTVSVLPAFACPPTSKRGSSLSSGPVPGLCVVLSLSQRPKERISGCSIALIALKCLWSSLCDETCPLSSGDGEIDGSVEKKKQHVQTQGPTNRVAHMSRPENNSVVLV